MTENSVIISFIIKMFRAVQVWFENSLYYRVFARIEKFFGKLFAKSGVYSLFMHKTSDNAEGFFTGFIKACFKLLYNILHNPFAKIGEKAKHSVFVNFAGFVVKNWYRISVRYYAVTVLVFAAIRLIIIRQAGRAFDTYTAIMLAFAATGLLIDVSLAGLYQGSAIRKFVGLPDLNMRFKLTADYKTHVAVTAAIVSGVVLGLCILLPYWYIFAVAVIGCVFIVCNPLAGTFILVVSLPFIPTMLAAGMTMLILASMLIKYLAGDEPEIRLDMFDAAIVMFCMMLIYGVINSFAPVSSVPIAMIYLVFVVSFFAIRRNLTEKKYFYALIDAMIAAAFVVSVYGVIQKLFGPADTTWQDEEMFESISGRIYATFGNPNVFGEYLLLMLPITYARLIMTKKPAHKIVYLASFALQLVCMILTYSRGCWIGLLAAMVLMIMFSGRKLPALGFLALFFIPFILPQSVIERFLSVGNTADSSTSYRVFIWEGTVRMLRDFGITGIGIGTDAFNSVYPAYALNAISAPHSHNLYLHILTEVGIVGAIVFVMVMWCYFKRLSHASKTCNELKPLCLGLGLGMLGFLIQGMFDNVWYNYRIYLLFFIMLALGGVIYSIAGKEKKNGQN